MSRHRNVRTLNYQDEYDGYDDVYGHSVEDVDFCVSPGTASEFMFDRNHSKQELSSYFGSEAIEEEEFESDYLNDSTGFKKPNLTSEQEVLLNSCLEELRNILGDSTPENVLVEAIIKAEFNFEKALNSILNTTETPKQQREPKPKRRNKGNRDALDTHASGANANAPTIILQKPNPPVTPKRQGNSEEVLETTATPGLAKMTFSTGTKAKSGFTPGKSNPDNAEHVNMEVEAVRRDLNLDVTFQVGGGSKPSSRNSSRSSSPAPNKNLDGATGFNSPAPGTPVMHKSASKAKMQMHDDKQEYERRKADGKDFINLVVIGHVDAGKSTLMGHVLYQLGFVNKKTMHKYEQDSKKLGKASFAYAWVLDETEEERSRGVTMDVAQRRFMTNTKHVTLLDAPGHKDFIPNMITGAAQADVAILVVNANKGEFETGFDAGGQTREHAMLIRSLGVSQLCIAVNKMDTVGWEEARFVEITKKLGHFLKQTGFKEKDLTYIPCSGLNGENLTKLPTEAKLKEWYKGPFLVQSIDEFKPPDRPVDKPLRMCVTDIYKGMGSGLSVAGTIQSGSVHPGDKILIMPQSETALVKSVLIDEVPAQYGFAGDSATVVLTGIDLTKIGIGSILCDISNPIQNTTRIQARIVVFNIEVPLTKGFPVEFHYQSSYEPAQIRKLISQLHKSSGEVVKKKPRCLTKNSSAVIELEVNRPVCIELYKNFKDLGRFMLRSSGATIAAGLVTEILPAKATKEKD